MTPKTALYFPHIAVPEMPWFTQVLLYWDKAASIVPNRQHVRAAMSGYMDELHAVDLLEYVDPQTVMRDSRESFGEGFLQLLDRASPRNGINQPQYVRVHIDKLSYQFVSELRQRGLARNVDPQRSDWCFVEESTAGLYMAYLASAVCGARPGTVPVTDHLDSLEMLGGTDESRYRRRVEHLSYSVIRKALPVPSGPIRPRDIIAFKERHSDELLRCRTYLDGKLADLALIDSGEIRDIKAGVALGAIEEELTRLQESMKRKWRDVSLAGVCGVASATIGTTQAMVAAGTPLTVGLAAGAGLLGVAAAAGDTAMQYRKRRFDRGAPLAYAALAARQFA